MESSSTSSSVNSASQWPNLPSDILTTIAILFGPNLGHLRLRSICHSWRTSLPLPSSPPPPPPLSLPSPPSLSSPLPPLSLLSHTLYLLTTTTTTTTTSSHFLLNLQQNNRFSLLTPFSSKSSLKLNNPINLLDFGITFICVSYFVERFDFFEKTVVSIKNGDVAVLGLTAVDRKLLICKYGDEKWTEIIHSVRVFDDIVSYNGNFYATADEKGRLVMIDFYGEKVIDLVSNLTFGCGFCASLIGCDSGLYLVDRDHEYGKGLRIEVFKLDEKGTFWDYEFDLNDCVFFLGDGVNLWLSPKDYHGSMRNVIYFDDHEGALVWDMKKRSMSSLVDHEAYGELFWPTSNWFHKGVAGIDLGSDC